MPGGGRCPDCGSAELVEDSHYSQSQLVCSDCGCVVTEGVLTTTYSDEGNLREVTYSRSTGENEQVSRSQQRGLRRVRDLCRVLQLPPTFEDTAVAYYQQAYRHSGIRAARLQKKEVLVGCCVLITCRQHNWPLTMGTICTLLYADLDAFSGTYMQIVKLLGLDVPSLCLADLVKTYCSSFKLFQASPSVPAKYVEDKEKMLSRTLQLVELADETWLVTGRHPLPVITAATFLAWQSLRPSDRLTCSLARFCKLANVDLPYPASSRLQELLAVLLRMAEQLAWLQVLKLNKRSVVKHISDLLQHRRTLVRKAFRDGTAEMEAQEEERQGQGQGQGRGKEEGGSSSLDLSEGKRGASPALLLPPCMLKPPKRIRPTPSVSTVTGDENISDSEIEQYLRTPQEVRDFLKAQAARQAAVSVPNPP
ncbi:transcription factor IIIB 50 kDa subunit [Diceros bicornis minor]|uniref:Transcription factor IIIB 50 kDa subunit n=1 Tax=Ceratotherium simum simum TaxID=73337 RepID=A0ABM0HKH0_CERSS|nr:PREDICTED: transcription factor IIIB 50 kDa subunit [Ceratotherium simum simum]XP_058381188.1 transcription factor IIIB 50 kDa subunit [Diceros bicornis minor]